MRKLIFSVLALILVSAALFAGGQQEQGEASNEEITLKWQVWITPNLDRPFYDEIAAAFEAEHENVTVEIIETSAAGTSGGSMDFIRNRIAAGDIPDAWSNFTDIPSFADAGHLWPMPADDPDLKWVRNLESTAYNGTLYSFASAVQPQSIMYYNKDLWEKCGLTEDDIPYTWADFESVCEIIKNAGYTPIATGGEWVPTIFWDYFVGAELTKSYPDLWQQIYDGKKKWNEPDVVEILEFMDRLVKKGYIIDGALSIGYSQLEQLFLSGGSVMYFMGSWFTAAEANADKDWKCGAFPVPTKDGKTNLMRSGGFGNGFAVAAASEHPELAFELIKKAVLDPVYGSKFIEADGLFSNLEPPLEYPMSPLQRELAELVSNVEYSYPILQHVLGAAPPPGIGDYYRTGAEAILSQSYSSLEDLLIQIDDFVEETM